MMSPNVFNRVAILTSFALCAVSITGCSDGGTDDTVATGATAGTDAGEAATGGTATGGATTGGVATTGGLTTGGFASGGAVTGGVATGGAVTGGAATGGVATGGAPTGGALTGGSPSGGAGTGGGPTGGDGTGGVETGGDGSGGAATGGVGAGGAGGSGGGVGDGFTLTSAEFQDGGAIPEAHTCASGDFVGAPAPSLSWSGAPDTTQSYALVFVDETLVDAGDDLGYHSAFWNLPATVTSLPVAFGSSDLAGAETINNGYLGPCPNFGGGSAEHTYVFTLYALPDASISLGSTLDAGFIETLASAALASAELTGISSASNQ